MRSYHELIKSISILIGRIAEDARVAASQGLTDIAILCEDVYVHVLNQLLGVSDVINLNKKSKNYPGIDLGSKSRSIGVQVTIDGSTAKVRDAIQKVIDHSVYEEYNEIKILVIGKKVSHNKKTCISLENLIDGRFTFDPKTDIWDDSKLIELIRELPENRLVKCYDILDFFCSGYSTESIISKLKLKSENFIEHERNTGKYIPGIFTESSLHKDYIRRFVNPLKFYSLIVHPLFGPPGSSLVRIQSSTGIKIPYEIPIKFWYSPSTLSDVKSRSKELLDLIAKQAEELKPYVNHNIRDAPNGWTKYGWLFESIRLRDYAYFRRDLLEKIGEFLVLANKRCLMVLSEAGQGKTNFICDSLENVLFKYGTPCTSIVINELNASPDASLKTLIERSVGIADQQCLFWEKIKRYCCINNTEFCVVIDAINESTNFAKLEVQLARLFDDFKGMDFVKFIITCRSEYFSDRFSRLKDGPCSREIHYIDKIQKIDNKEHLEHRVRRYFEHFSIDGSMVSGCAQSQILHDPLLLRMFCEVYKDGRLSAPIHQVHRHNIFEKYLEYKINEIQRTLSSGTSVGVSYTSRSAMDVLYYIVKQMFDNLQFKDVVLEPISREWEDVVSLLIGCDVILRKDIVASSVFGVNRDVINFTYDELRDYLIVRYAIENKISAEIFYGILGGKISGEQTIVEGVQRYLFYGYKEEYPNFPYDITTQEWYHDVFAREIFNIEEDHITDGDVGDVRDLISRNNKHRMEVMCELINRWDVAVYVKLNVNIIISTFVDCNETTYELLAELYRASNSYCFRCYSIPQIGEAMLKIARISRYETESVGLLKLLLVMLGIDFRNESAAEIAGYVGELITLAEDSTIQAIIDIIQACRSDIETGIWTMLIGIYGKKQACPNELLSFNQRRMKNLNKIDDRWLRREIEYFNKSISGRDT